MLRGSVLQRVVISILTTVLITAAAGCRQTQAKTVYGVGEKVVSGPLSYNVIDASWKAQLGESFKVRLPEQRFLVITLSITNGSGHDISIPFLQIEDEKGNTREELQNGEGVDNWLGMLRTVSPAQTIEGKILFDAPLTSYRLRLPDGSQPGQEHFVWAEIPLQIDTDAPIAPTVP